MSKPARFQPKDTPRGWCLNVPAKFTADGKRARLYFPLKKDALARAAELRERAGTYGTAAATIRPSLAEDATLAAEILAPWNITLSEAARIVAELREAAAASCPLAEAVDAWLDDCRDNLREKTLQGYKSTGKRLTDALGTANMATLAADELAAAIMPKGTPVTAARGHLRTAKAFWKWSARKGWCDAAAIDSIEPPRKRDNGEITVLTVAEAEQLLRTAEVHFPEVAAHYAIALFAGVRAEEIKKLQAADVSASGIELSARITKKGRRRHITPNDTLHAWLTRYPFAPCADWKRIDCACRCLAGWRVRPAGGMAITIPDDFDEREPWPQNALRHSHASYALAAGETLETLLFTFGHATSPDVLRSHYVGRVSRKNALAFLSIMPAGVEAPALIQAV